jgi:hypothetical protein
MQKVYNDPTIPWRRQTFAIQRDSADTVNVELINNPPADEIDDKSVDSTQ